MTSRSGRRRIFTVAAVGAVLAAAVGLLIVTDDEHEPGSVLRPTDLAGLGLSWQHTAPSDCSVVACLESGLVVGERAVQVDDIDLAFASTVFGGALGRTYRSDVVADPAADRPPGMFGPGWLSIFDSRLVIGASSAELSTPPTADRVVAIGRLDGVLSALWASGELWQFEGLGRLARIESPTGQAIDVEWDGNDLSTVSFGGGRALEVATEDGLVTEVTGTDDRAVNYRYAAGRLVGVSGPSGDRSYRYGESGLLETASAPTGETEVGYDDSGQVTELSVGGRGPFEVSGALPTVTVRDTERDTVNVYEFDPEGRLVREVADGTEVLSRSFDDDGRLVRSDAPGQHVEMSYDGNGRVARIVQNGTPTEYGYDSLGRTTRVSTADGGQTTYHYEGSSAVPASVTDALAGVTRMAYDDGRLSRVVDPDGVSETYRHDEAGNLVSITDANGAETEFEYDATGRLVGRETPEGARSSASFDDAGQVRVFGDDAGTQTVYDYSAAGEPSAVVGPEGISSLSYGSAGELVSQSSPAGPTVEYGYTDGKVSTLAVSPSASDDPVELTVSGASTGDASSISGPSGETRVVAYREGRPSEIDLPGGRRQSLRYDAGGRLTEVSVDGVVAAAYGYDPVGRLIRTEDDGGVIEERTYDRAGRLVEIRYPDGTSWQATWTAGGRIESVRDPEGRTTSWSYDDAGQVDEMTSPMGTTVSVDHDADGRVVGLIGPRGVSWSYRYDAGGRLVTAETPAGPVGYQWDRAGRLLSRVDSGGEESQWVYDDEGRLVNVKLPGDENDLDWAYDGLGNVASWEEGERRWEVERDEAGRPISVDPPEDDDEYTIEWDAAGNPAVIGYDDRTEQRRYDALGQVVEASYGDDGTFELRRDGAITAVVDQGDADEPVVEYEHDDRGRVVRVQWGDDDDERVRAEWDHVGRPLMLASGDGEVTIERDADGQFAEARVDGETALTAEYSGGQISEVRSSDEEPLTFEYDDGRVSRVRSGDLSATFDPAGRPATFETGGDDGRFRYGDDGIVDGVQFGEDETTVTVEPVGELGTDGDAGDLVEAVFEPDGTFRGLPAADAVPEFPYLDGLPAEFTPVGLTPTSPEQHVAQTVAAIDVAVPEPLELDGSPEEIARDTAEALRTTPVALAVHPGHTALVQLYDEAGEPQSVSLLDEPLWAGLLGGISERQDTTGAFDWVTTRITSVVDWATTAVAAVAGSIIESFTDPLNIFSTLAEVAATAACVATAVVCPAFALPAIGMAAFLFPAVVEAFTGDQSISEIVLQTVTAAAIGAATGFFLGRVLRPAFTRVAPKIGACELVRIVCYSADQYGGTAPVEALGVGRSTVLTPDSSLASANRRAALRDVPTRLGFDRDEFPFAATRQGGLGATVVHVDPGLNRSAGARVGAQLRAAGGRDVLFIITP